MSDDARPRQDMFVATASNHSLMLGSHIKDGSETTDFHEHAETQLACRAGVRPGSPASDLFGVDAPALEA